MKGNLKNNATTVLAGLVLASAAQAGVVPAAGFGSGLANGGLNLPGLPTGHSFSVQLQSKQLFSNFAIKALLSNTANRLDLDRVVEIGGFRTIQYRHFYNGLPVVGSAAKIHDSADFQDMSVSSTMAFDLDTVPSVAAEDVALRAHDFAEGVSLLSAPELRVLPTPGQNSARLIYWTPVQTTTGRHTMLFDAHTGQLLADLPSRISAAPVTIVSAHKIPASQIDPKTGMPTQLDPKYLTLMVKEDAVLPAADDSAKRALKAIGNTLKYYKDVHNRDSYDDKGGRVASIVHFGRNFANAFWTGEGNFMAYGDGSPAHGIGDMTLGADVTGHEMTHGVVDHSIFVGDEQGLLYFRDSGALNEAIADFLGELSQGNPDWVMGKDLFLDPAVGANGIRNLTDPSKNKEVFLIETGPHAGELEDRPGPTVVAEKFEVAKGNGTECFDYNDNCYVHANSSIPSHAMYLILKKIGQEKAEKLVYHTLTHFLTPTATFEDFRAGMEKSCKALSFSAADCGAVTKVFEAQGFKLPPPAPTPVSGGTTLVWK